MRARVYSERLGVLGQNVFVTSTTGAWVLRGAPHYDWQLPAERFSCEQLHTRTRTPVPWPYLIDPSDDIFGWSYAIMPRMPGLQMSDPGVAGGLTHEDRLGLALESAFQCTCSGTASSSGNTFSSRNKRHPGRQG